MLLSSIQSLFRHHTNVAQFLLTDRQTELEEKKSAISSCYQKFLLLCILEHCENFLLFFIIFFLVTCLFMWNRPEPCPQEANVNNNNSLEAPIRGLLFGGKLEERNCHHPAPHQTSNHAQLVQRKSRMVLYSKASSVQPFRRDPLRLI